MLLDFVEELRRLVICAYRTELPAVFVCPAGAAILTCGPTYVPSSNTTKIKNAIPVTMQHFTKAYNKFALNLHLSSSSFKSNARIVNPPIFMFVVMKFSQ